MSKENEGLVHVFNDYLNKQEKMAVAPNAEKEENLQAEDYSKVLGKPQIKLDDNQSEFLVYQKSKGCVIKDGGENLKFANIRPERLTDEERYKKMKNILKGVKVESFEHGMMSIEDMMEWAMSTAAIDGASDDFMAIVIAIKDAVEAYKKQKATEARLNEINAKKAKGEATDEELLEAEELNHKAVMRSQSKFYALSKSAHNYANNNDGKKWSSKGKCRQAFVNHILSKDFIERYVVKFTSTQLMGSEFPEYLDADSYALAYEMNEGQSKLFQTAKSQVFVNGHRRGRFAGFTMADEHRLPLLSLYDQSRALSSDEAMEEERERVTNAITSYLGKEVTGTDENGEDIVKEIPVDKEPIYTILDEVVKQVCEFKVSEKYFTKEYWVEHPAEIFKLRRLSQILGDCLDETGNVSLGTLGTDYLALIKNNESYTKFYAKLSFMTHFWFAIVDFLVVNAGIKAETIRSLAVVKDPVLVSECYYPVPTTDVNDEYYDEEPYNEYAEQRDRSPKEWIEYSIQEARRDYHVTEAMKAHLNKSILSKIEIPRRDNQER